MTEDKLDTLLEEYESQRNALKDMVKNLEEIKVKVDKLFPEKLDSRYMRLFEEKIKTTTELFKAILDIRKELNKSIKDEIEIRRRATDKSSIDSDESISELAKRISNISKKENNVIPIKMEVINE